MTTYTQKVFCVLLFAKTESAVTLQRASRIKFVCKPLNGCVSTLLSSIGNSDVLGFAILALESEAWLQERRTNSSAGGVGYGGGL
ncbi:hypothetical protein TNCV_4524701 [Trichonephila clavipes]|nr:hypothetical protein TNCV_4524701 [Trichonephila clavipes]